MPAKTFSKLLTLLIVLLKSCWVYPLIDRLHKLRRKYQLHLFFYQDLFDKLHKNIPDKSSKTSIHKKELCWFVVTSNPYYFKTYFLKYLKHFIPKNYL